MRDVKIFSVIILHYNQNKFWRYAVDSVLTQNYNKIQLIFSDDCSTDFDKAEVENYIVKNMNDNLCSFQVITSDINKGTVKNLNLAIKHTTGKYIYIFAADDVLYNEFVLCIFAEALEQYNNNICGIYGRSIKCNYELEPIGEDYIDPYEAVAYNEMNPAEQFEHLCEKCRFPIGAMAFRREKYLQYFPHDESYHLIEDWPFFLKVTRNKEKFWFINYPILLYREGGVSRPVKSDEIIEKWSNKDYITIYDKEIWPYCEKLRLSTILKIARIYDYNRTGMKRLDPTWNSIKRIYIMQHSFKYIVVFMYRFFFHFLEMPNYLNKRIKILSNLRIYLFDIRQ